MIIGKLTARRSTVRVAHSWHQAYISALRESDSGELIDRVEYAISAIERRYSEWETDPGSPAELAAIRKCIAILAQLMKRERLRVNDTVSTPSTGSSDTTSFRVDLNI